MEIFFTTFQAVATLLGVGVLGFWLISRRIVKSEVFSLLSPLAIDVAVPALVFANILYDFDPDVNPNWWLLPIWWIGFTVLAGLMTAASSLICTPGYRREFLISLFYQNGLFFPLVILSGLYGPSSSYIVDLFVFGLLYPVFLFNTWQFFFHSKGGGLNWKRALNPILLATIAALLIRLLDVQGYFPEVIGQVILLTGAMATPVLMIILGGNIYLDFKDKIPLQRAEVAKFVAVKNFVFPLVTLGVLVLIRPPFGVALIMLLQAAVPPVTAVPILVERGGGNRALVGQFMAASMMASIVSIPLMLALFGMFFSTP